MPKAANKKPRLRNLLLTHQKNAEANRRTEGRKNAVRPSKRSKTSGSGFHTAAQSVPAKAPSKGKQSKTIPYSAGDRILMIGEGNFSFALALLTTETIKATPSLLVATSYDSQDECYTKYPDAQEIVSKLRAFGATVLFGIDATKLDNHEDLLGKAFDRISFNFPHAGAGIKDQDRNILANQKLIVGFFQSCAPFLARGKVPPFHISQTPKKRKHSDNDSDDRGSGDDESSDSDSAVSPNSELQTSELLGKTGFRGSVLITLRNSPPYTLWDVPRLAKKPPIPPSQISASRPIRTYQIRRSFVFDSSDYPGYEHRRTIGGATGLGPNEDLKRTGVPCRTWEFVLSDTRF